MQIAWLKLLVVAVFKFMLMKKRMSQNLLNEYDQEIPQSQTADNPVAPRNMPNHHETPGRKLISKQSVSLPHQDDCNTT